MGRLHQQSWRDLQLELEKKHDHEDHAESSECPDCMNKLYFLEGGFLCPVCGYSMETVYS
ncbi:hypothetical protein KC909_06325 [Candidatus Dojkabacteria bacterium]|uniref:Uncharacterized protein n=1 Tax=Candidatus Dojkabacteria bacterium TaxID=2099670 RepID=A0A955L763_9BACT|nr:hypothetical protein [Candidatus Dojkabacteria bacterium]